MKKIYAFLAGVVIASGVSAATLERAPKISMEKATVVGRLENAAMKKVADLSKKVLSRADESEAPEITGDYLLCYTNYSTNNGTTTTRMAPSNNLVPTENEGEYQFETFIFSDTSLKGKLHYDPEFWKDEAGNPVGEWVLSIGVGDEASEPLFYDDLSQFASYGFTNNEPIYFYLVSLEANGKLQYYSDDAYELVVRDGYLMSPYLDGFGLGMASRFIEGVGGVTYSSGYLNLFTALPNAHGTAIETASDGTEVVSEEVEFPMYTETFEMEGTPCLYVRGLCGWPGEQVFILSQEEQYAYTVEMPLTVIQDYELYMTQDAETTEVLMEITPETEGQTIMSTEFIGLIDASDVEGGLWATYEEVVVAFDYNVWTGDAQTGIKSAEIDDVNAPTVYYNMQGMEISNPAAGEIYIVKKGNKVSKQIIK